MARLPLRLLLIVGAEDWYQAHDTFIACAIEQFEVTWVYTYQAALESLQSQQHDVYLVNTRLGEQSGLEFIREAVQRGYQAPLIVLTPPGATALGRTAVAEGAADYLDSGELSSALLQRVIQLALARQLQPPLQGEHERLFQSLIEGSIQGILIHHELTPLFVNQAFADMFGYANPAEVLSLSSVETLILPADRERLRHYHTERVHGMAVPMHYEFQGVRKDGAVIWVDCKVIALTWHGKPATQAALFDISDRKRLEAQLRELQKMEAIGTLAGGIAHDFNNILAAMLGYTELALYDISTGSKAWGSLQQVLTAGQRARELVQQILTFSRRGNAERKPVHIAALIAEGLRLIRATLPATIEIHQDLDSEAGAVLADPTQITQILMNLCTNAADAMQHTAGILEVRLFVVTSPNPAQLSLPPGSYVGLTVQDTGHGMAPAVLERIFDPFFTTKGPGRGTGMGLAVVHGIVTSHGGRITVESEVGRGTNFTVYLPRIEETVGHTAPDEETLTQGRECILFVDDEDMLARLGQELLTRLGYQVVVRTSSIEALEAFRAAPQRFDLVITDQTMPNMTGEELTRALRRLRPDIPVILCTGFSQSMSAEKARAMGIDAFVMKPLVARDLALTLRRVLAQRAGHTTPQHTRILVIDDDAQMRQMLRQTLEQAGYEVAEASNGREGFRRYQSFQPALVVTDILMPEQDGLETITAMRKADPHVNIIAITGGGRSGWLDMQEVAKRLGARQTLWKPFDAGTLLKAVVEALQT